LLSPSSFINIYINTQMIYKIVVSIVAGST
jgi:hypothetical protein